MKTIASNKGFTLMELLIAISLISLFVATLLPTVVQFRQREQNWREAMHMEQEAIRFFSYLENRNAGAKNWSIQGKQITIEHAEQQGGKWIKKRIYLLGDRIIETDVTDATKPGGALIMAQLVKDIRFTQNGQIVTIDLTLSKSGLTKTFQGFFSRVVEQ